MLAKAKHRTEAPVNGGRNYNGPKVAKFLVGQVPTRTKGVTTWALSRRGARRNCNIREDADYPRLDGKTPWSFTATWHWILVMHVQDRWEAGKQDRQVLWSRPWDTTLASLKF